MSDARDRLIAMVASRIGTDVVDDAWAAGTSFVAAMEAEPDKPVRCPCCTKLVTLCVKHYQLHEPSKPCVTCRSGE